ncbi:hypothetical protein ZIOFF_018659 [Zingiber officinale]|uniref:Transmembrane protein n=1 Tax=Zingiber officinale TaxID=94328 RepID=A0A8J5LIW1_ZINOF|nr:hypothetical protein ZIOFF_018659 [Zingiber officinale]
MSGNRKKFGGGRPPSGTPSLPLSCAVVVVSLLAGASIVHNIYKPDLTLPPVDPPPPDESKGNNLNFLADVLWICPLFALVMAIGSIGVLYLPQLSTTSMNCLSGLHRRASLLCVLHQFQVSSSFLCIPYFNSTV